MLAQIKLATSAQTPGLVGEDNISIAKVSEHLGTTHGCINLVQTHSKDRNQVSSRFSKAHDLNSAPNPRDQDPSPHLATDNAIHERPPPERDKLTSRSAGLVRSYLLTKIKHNKIKRKILVTHQEDKDYLIDRGNTAMSSKYLSTSAISHLFAQLLDSEIELVSNYKTELNNKVIEEQLGVYSLKLDTPRIDAETTMITFSAYRSSHSTSHSEWSLIKTSALGRGLGGPLSSLLMEASPTYST